MDRSSETPSISSTVESHITCQNQRGNLKLTAKSQIKCKAYLVEIVVVGVLRLNAKRQRQRARDKVAVPDLSREAEAALSRIDRAPANERSAKVEELRASASGRSILEEVGRVSTAMQQRFGTSVPAEIKARAGQDPQLSRHAERVANVAKFIARTANEQTRHQQALEKQGQKLSHGDRGR